MKKNEKKINKTNFLIIILIFLLIFSFCIKLYLIINAPISQSVIEVKCIAGDRIGMAINDSIVDFGIIPVGLSANKKINLENTYNFPINVSIYINGNISKYLYGENYFILQIGERKEYDINLILPNNLDYGQYSGQIIFEFRK